MNLVGEVRIREFDEVEDAANRPKYIRLAATMTVPLELLDSHCEFQVLDSRLRGKSHREPSGTRWLDDAELSRANTRRWSGCSMLKRPSILDNNSDCITNSFLWFLVVDTVINVCIRLIHPLLQFCARDASIPKPYGLLLPVARSLCTLPSSTATSVPVPTCLTSSTARKSRHKCSRPSRCIVAHMPLAQPPGLVPGDICMSKYIHCFSGDCLK
jgi:hypothetical protein